jgi:microcompartment protein CcmK/EutM
MILCRVESAAVATVKNEHLKNHKILACRPVKLDGQSTCGPAFLAVDRVRAGEGDLVLVINEGSSVRLVFGNPKIPLTAFIAAIVDDLDVADEGSLIGASVVEQSSAQGSEE